MTKVGVIGLGMGQAHLKGYSDIADVEILGIADIDRPRDVFLVPKPIVPLVLVANRMEETVVGVVDFALVPTLDGFLVQVCNSLNVDHHVACLT